MSEIERMEAAIRGYKGKPIKLMEVCGTHTHSIFENGVPALLPSTIRLISGPGCPVCVTPDGYIDRAAEISQRSGWALCSFGDMLRVPGTQGSLLDAKASGGDVRMMYSPMDVIGWAAKEPQTTFCIAAVGFETTLPVYALLVERLLDAKLTNVKLLTSVKAMIPALHWICKQTPDIDGFIGPGHVSAIIGSEVYAPLCQQHRIPLAVGGFTYPQVLAAIVDLLTQINDGTCESHNLYTGVVPPLGNVHALSKIDRYFEADTASWRGLGDIPGSGYVLKPEYSSFDAGSREVYPQTAGLKGCLCGQVIIGRVVPSGCPHFGKDCTPMNPLGPCMVSAEGTCGIWYQNQP